jgi:hypothetical protein
MSKLTVRQVAVLRRADATTSAACTTWLCPAGMTVAQTGNVCRQLEPKGYMVRERGAWRITSSGHQWLRSLDAGRPWMVRKPALTGETGGAL